MTDKKKKPTKKEARRWVWLPDDVVIKRKKQKNK